jgi:integrase
VAGQPVGAGRALECRGRRRGEQDVKSDAGERTVPILAPLVPLLAGHKLATGRDCDALVFDMTADHPFDPSSLRRRALAAWKAAELTPITLHEGRHTFASLLIASGANPKVIQTVMGHSTIQMTFDQYGHLMPGGRGEAAAATDADLARSVGS